VSCRYEVLGLSDGIDDGSSDMKWDLVLCLLLAWIIVFCCLIRGIKSAGKVSGDDILKIRSFIRDVLN